MFKLINDDCLKAMADIPDGSIDLCLTDPPYGTTACKWDTVIPFEPMWEQLKRIVKPNGAICLFGQNPFTSNLIMSNPKFYKHDWVWVKEQGTGFLNAKKYPLKDNEFISVFSFKPCCYYPQMRKGKPYKFKTENTTSSGKQYGNFEYKVRVSNGKRYPLTTIKFNREQSKNVLHPTQKPVALLEYLIKTYTLENETVLDFTMGSGSTGVACKNLNRKFIGIEKDRNYFEIAKKRIVDV